MYNLHINTNTRLRRCRSLSTATTLELPTDGDIVPRAISRISAHGGTHTRSKLARPPGPEVPRADADTGISANHRQYTHEKLRQDRVDEHWEFMLDEILAEVKLGRMNGPFKAPAWWPRETVCPSKCTTTSGETLPLPRDDPFIAVAFSIEHIEKTGSDGNTKIRRGEDWPWSGPMRRARCTTSRSTILRTTSCRWAWPSLKSHPPRNWQCGVTITTEHTDNCHSMIHDRLMCCC